MSKKTTTLPKLEDYKAPWEVDSTGAEIPEDEQKIDGARLRKYLYNLLSDKVGLEERVTTVTGERDALQTKLDEKAREGETDEQTKQRQVDEAIAAAKAEGGLEAAKLRAALKIEGITPAQAEKLAARLQGTKPEEFEADAKSLAEDFGIGGKQSDDDGEGDEDGEGEQPFGRPRRLRAGGDPDPHAVTLPSPSDAAKVDELFPRR